MFKAEDNLARLDYAKYEPSGQDEAGHDKCSTGAIVYRGTSAPASRPPEAKQAASNAA